MKLARIAARLRAAWQRPPMAARAKGMLYWRKRRRPMGFSSVTRMPGRPGASTHVTSMVTIEHRKHLLVRRGLDGAPGASAAASHGRAEVRFGFALPAMRPNAQTAMRPLAHRLAQPVTPLAAPLPAPAITPLAPAVPRAVHAHSAMRALSPALAWRERTPVVLSRKTQRLVSDAAPARALAGEVIHTLRARPAPIIAAVARTPYATPTLSLPHAQRARSSRAPAAPSTQAPAVAALVLHWRQARTNIAGASASGGHQGAGLQPPHPALTTQAGRSEAALHVTEQVLAEARAAARQEMHSPLNVDRLAEELMRRVDKRMRIERERRGR